MPLSQALRSLPVALILVMVLLTGLYMAALLGTFALYANRVLLPGQAATVVARTVGVMITVIGLVTALVQVVLLKPVVGYLGERKATVAHHARSIARLSTLEPAGNSAARRGSSSASNSQPAPPIRS